MRFVLVFLLADIVAAAAAAQPLEVSSACPGGQCPLVPSIVAPSVTAPGQPSADLQVDARAIVRVFNAVGSGRAAGSGTLVDVGADHGLVVTCAHLFRDGSGTLSVAFPNQQTYAARLVKADAAADLAALVIAPPGVEPIAIAARYPRRGEPLVSCGYGGDGRLWCNRGQALGYVAAAPSRDVETLELSGTARLGDSGGPVLDQNHQLAAVLFGTNGRVVDGTYCGRVRSFLGELSPRYCPPPQRRSRRRPRSLRRPCLARLHRQCRRRPRKGPHRRRRRRRSHRSPTSSIGSSNC